MKTEGLTYDEAHVWLKSGVMVARKAWEGQFVFRQVSNVVPFDRVQGMASLPESVRTEFMRHGKNLSYSNQTMFCDPTGDVVEMQPYEPDRWDLHYNDWYVL